MKKNMKNIVIYGLILMLCTVAMVEYIQSRSADTQPRNAEVEVAAVVGIPAHVREVMEKSAEILDSNPVIGIGRGTDYAEVTEEAISNAGGLEDIVKKGDVVLIKPNLCTDAKPDSPITTDYRVVKKVAELAKRHGASKVIIAEGSFAGQTFNEITFKQNLYDTIEDVEFFNINDCEEKDCYELTTENSLIGKALFVPKVYMDADVVITVAKMKTHYIREAVVSLSLKNCFGAISTRIYGTVDKGGLHGFNLSNAITQINKIRRPDFAVIDGIVGGEGYGPAKNTPVASNIILAGKDPAALDTIALTFMGFEVDQVPHVKLAGERNIGITDISKINVVGAVLEEIKMHFKR